MRYKVIRISYIKRRKSSKIRWKQQGQLFAATIPLFFTTGNRSILSLWYFLFLFNVIFLNLFTLTVRRALYSFSNFILFASFWGGIKILYTVFNWRIKNCEYDRTIKFQIDHQNHRKSENQGPVSLFLSFFVVASNVVTFLTRNMTKLDVTTFYGKKNTTTFWGRETVIFLGVGQIFLGVGPSPENQKIKKVPRNQKNVTTSKKCDDNVRRIAAHFFDAFWHIFFLSSHFFFTVLVGKMRRLSSHVTKKSGRETGPWFRHRYLPSSPKFKIIQNYSNFEFSYRFMFYDFQFHVYQFHVI